MSQPKPFDLVSGLLLGRVEFRWPSSRAIPCGRGLPAHPPAPGWCAGYRAPVANAGWPSADHAPRAITAGGLTCLQKLPVVGYRLAAVRTLHRRRQRHCGLQRQPRPARRHRPGPPSQADQGRNPGRGLPWTSRCGRCPQGQHRDGDRRADGVTSTHRRLSCSDLRDGARLPTDCEVAG
jgi:hypothetical protein